VFPPTLRDEDTASIDVQNLSVYSKDLNVSKEIPRCPWEVVTTRNSVQLGCGDRQAVIKNPIGELGETICDSSSGPFF